MNVEVLASVMHQKDYSILEEMNIKTDAIIINQCDNNQIDRFLHKDRSVLWMSLNERGVGLSRNTALMRATQEICVFADDDVVYVDDYETKMLEAFHKNPKADLIFFNLPVINESRKNCEINTEHRVHCYNYMRYGTYNIAFRLSSIRKKSICFSQLFGGGCRYGSGEDTIFISDCLKNGLRLFASPDIIGHVKQESSTWFQGYNDKFLQDKGALFQRISSRWSILLCIQLIVRHWEWFSDNYTFMEAFQKMQEGRRSYINENV